MTSEILNPIKISRSATVNGVNIFNGRENNDKEISLIFDKLSNIYESSSIEQESKINCLTPNFIGDDIFSPKKVGKRVSKTRRRKSLSKSSSRSLIASRQIYHKKSHSLTSTASLFSSNVILPLVEED